jgi:glycosyltransferase involved in cell wall biosynthesis
MSKYTPKISIYISSYQQKKYLDLAIKSALAQDYPNLEIIIVDDCSTDGSRELIETYLRTFPSLLKANFNAKNEGMIKNFNTGIQLCSGEYIMRLDGDDILMPNCVSKQVEFLLANPDLMACYPNLEVFDSESDKTICLYVNNQRPMRIGSVKNVIKYGCFFSGAFSLIKRSEIPKNGYRQAVESVCDYYFMVEVLMPKKKMGYVDEVLGRYRIHGDNVTQNRGKLIIHTFKAVMSIIKNYPSYTMAALYRIFDAGRAVFTKRNKWLH